MRRSNTRGHANNKSTDPDDYMGVYKRIETVPERYRLRNFQSRFLDQDVWGNG